MDEYALNKKLAEWAGFKPHLLKHDPMDKPPDTWGWEIGEGLTKLIFDRPLDFTDSLDACFQWLVPKLISYRLDNLSGEHTVIIGMKSVIAISTGETPALALCLAIEKVIDKSGLR